MENELRFEIPFKVGSVIEEKTMDSQMGKLAEILEYRLKLENAKQVLKACLTYDLMSYGKREIDLELTTKQLENSWKYVWDNNVSVDDYDIKDENGKKLSL